MLYMLISGVGEVFQYL